MIFFFIIFLPLLFIFICFFFFFFFNDTATTEIYTLSLHDALPLPGHRGSPAARAVDWRAAAAAHAVVRGGPGGPFRSAPGRAAPERDDRSRHPPMGEGERVPAGDRIPAAALSRRARGAGRGPGRPRPRRARREARQVHRGAPARDAA